MPDCEENVKAIYQNATVTEAMMETTYNKDREIVIVKDFDPFLNNELDSCEGNNYIISFEYCDPTSTVKTRRNFVSYEGLISTANYICSGTSLVNINNNYDYDVIDGGANGWSIQKAIESLDASLTEVVGTGLNYLKDGPTDASLIGSNGTNDSVITGNAEHQINLGNYEGSMNDSPNSTIANGKNNIMNSVEYGFIGSGENNVIEGEAFGFIGTGRDNEIIDGYASIIATGQLNKIEGGAYSSILNGLSNKTNNSFVNIMNGKYAGGETHGETIFGADRLGTVSEESYAQYASVVMNATTTDNATAKTLYLSDDIDAELITAPLNAQLTNVQDGGALSGKLTLTGTFISDANNAECGQPVWINNLDPTNNTAQVTDSEQKSITIDVHELEEGNQVEKKSH